MHELSDPRMVPNNLPKQLTRFIGRLTEIASVKQFLSESRLVTLTGAGGTGKSRLALRAAEELLFKFPDGVFFVEVAPLSDPAMIPSVIANTLGVQTTSAEPVLTTLVDFLSRKEILMILDNCEHLVSGCAEVASYLLAHTEMVSILATSREGLAVSGERPWLVPPLPVPQPSQRLTEEDLVKYESVQLFLERAVIAKSDFVLSESDVPAVIEICHQLDGIPLAIELAAARICVLSPADIAERLHERFRLLTSRNRSVLPHQRTLRALVDWSFDLLTEAEQKAWSRLSVFAGTFTLEAAEAVIAVDTFDEWDVIDYLSRLVEKSILMSIQTEDGVRYRMLETIRQYGEEKLREADELDATRVHAYRHYAGWCRRIMNASVSDSTSEGMLHWVRPEEDNLRTALRYTLASQDAQAALDLANLLGQYWYLPGNIAVGREKLKEVLSLPGCTNYPEQYCSVLNRAAFLAIADQDVAESLVLLERAKLIGEKTNVSFYVRRVTLHYLAGVLMDVDTPRVKTLLNELLQLSADDTRWTCTVLMGLGSVNVAQEDYATADRLFQEAEVLASDYRYDYLLASAIGSRGMLAMALHDWEHALGFCRCASDRYRKVGSVVEVVQSLISLAFCERQVGDYSKCDEHLEEALVTSVRLNLPVDISNYRMVATLLTEYGEHSTAVSLLQATKKLGLPVAWTKKYERAVLDEARQALGDTGYEVAVKLGTEVRLSELTERALTAWRKTGVHRLKNGSPSEEVVGNERQTFADTYNLTSRELDILATIAKGYSNRQAADELFLTQGTVRTYLSRVYSKLGVSSRTEALMMARQLGLIDN